MKAKKTRSNEEPEERLKDLGLLQDHVAIHELESLRNQVAELEETLGKQQETIIRLEEAVGKQKQRADSQTELFTQFRSQAEEKQKTMEKVIEVLKSVAAQWAWVICIHGGEGRLRENIAPYLDGDGKLRLPPPISKAIGGRKL